MRFTLRQLQIFLSVAHHQNLTKAANELAMSQSAASSALKELEERYDVQLFDRIGKSLQLNEQGQYVRNKAEALIAHAEELERSLLKHADAEIGRAPSELQSRPHLVCRLLLEKKKKNTK